MELLVEEEEKRMDSESDARSLAAISCSSFFPGGASSWFEIRLFYVRITPCVADATPSHLTLVHLRREMGVGLEINGARIPASETTSVFLRRDRVDRRGSEVTYVSTDSVRLSGAVDFEVRDGDELLLCGALERMDMPWGSSVVHSHPGPLATTLSSDKDSKTGWSMDCYFGRIRQPKLEAMSPSIEVYVAGCCSGLPLILTQTVQHSPRRKSSRLGTLDAIPEDDENNGKEQRTRCNQEVHRRSLSSVGEDESEIEKEGKREMSFYYGEEDGQLTWFNAGVRVGVGIGLGMCLGLGLGAGLLMRSYQATTRNFKRRFF